MVFLLCEQVVHPDVITTHRCCLSHFDLKKHKDSVGTLHLACTTICRMNMGATAHWKVSQAGLLVSTTFVLRLSEELLNKYRYKYLLTGRLSQDCLENIFSTLTPETCPECIRC